MIMFTTMMMMIMTMILMMERPISVILIVITPRTGPALIAHCPYF